MDVSIVISVEDIKQKPDYTAAKQKMVAETSKCTLVRPSEDELESLRSDVSSQSSCSKPMADGAVHMGISLGHVVVALSAALVALK